jgi:predicted alpha/beta-fold hydrolase
MSPKKGGHVAFTILGKGGEYWAEQKAVDFVMNYVE